LAKRTAVIDIGSNSIRVAVYEKSSRYGFYLLYETKSKARLSEGTYQNGGKLQEIPMQKTFSALRDFLSIIRNLKCTKTLCVATSALRDAPNRSVFINRVKKELSLSIKVIDGKKEAYYTAVAVNNLLYRQKSAIAVDTGGGSTEFALLQDGNIVDVLSLKIGTIRIKELFSDGEDGIKKAKEYIRKELSKLPANFISKNIIGIGGSARAISKAIMSNEYPINTLHAFEYSVKENMDFIKNIYNCSIDDLKRYNIKKDRYDTIREGALILYEILNYFNSKKVITSGVGVREGVYLCDLLRNSNHKFPHNFNVDVRSLEDRFSVFSKVDTQNAVISKKIFDTLLPLHSLDQKYKNLLVIAAKLSSIGTKVNFFSNNQIAYNMILESLNYGISHKDKVLIALTVKYQGKKLLSKKDLKFYSSLLPDEKVLNTLSFILALTKCLTKNMQKQKFDFILEDKILKILTQNRLYLTEECLNKIENPFEIKLFLENNMDTSKVSYVKTCLSLSKPFRL